MKIINHSLAAVLAFAALQTGTATAQADYPSKPIRFIVPFPAGGGTDIIARHVANKMNDVPNWKTIVDNVAGAGGNIGLGVAAKAAPDGLTLVLGQTSNLAIAPSLYGKIPYDPVKDFAPVTLVTSVPVTFMVAADSPYKTLADLVKAAKTKPGEITFATSGNGTVAHLATEMFKRTAGIDMLHVPYKGAAAAFPDLIGGRVHVFVSSLETGIPQIKSKTVRALAVASMTRTTSVPDVPTFHESGYKNFEALTWFGVLAPAGTPDAIVTRLSAEITKILKMPDVQEKFATTSGGEIKTGPKEFSALLKSELVKWSKVVKESGAKLD
ncbi:MAG: tripartite tricarboxylate transporter substrate binding protein [Betaproteobacteria bacterium]|nr:tripartite tricarboxylate transporter substrate binding protein [Betaproteobacteria bacterium]